MKENDALEMGVVQSICVQLWLQGVLESCRCLFQDGAIISLHRRKTEKGGLRGGSTVLGILGPELRKQMGMEGEGWRRL